MNPIFLYSPVVISIVGGILVPFLLGARDFNWLLSSFALTLFLILLLAGLQPYIAKHLVAPRLAWCNELTSLGVTRALHRKEERDAARAERDAARAKREAFLRASEAPILLDLAHLGIQVESLDDLCKTPFSYVEAIPVLREHKGRPYPDEIMRRLAHALSIQVLGDYGEYGD